MVVAADVVATDVLAAPASIKIDIAICISSGYFDF